MTDIQRCEIRPGRLVEWTLAATTVEAACGLPEDPRPPSYVQEFHLRSARSVRDQGLSVPNWLGTAFDLPGRVDIGVLEAALHAWTLRHETLRSGFRWVGDEVRRFTLDAGAVALERADVGEFTDGAALARHLERRFDRTADALVWPNFLFSAVVREEGSSVLLAFDHSNVDAGSIYRIPAEIHELYAAELAGRAARLPSAASYVDFCADERGRADAIDGGHPTVARWREFIRRCGGAMPPFPVDLGIDQDGPMPPQRFLSEPLVGDAEAVAFEAYCRPYGGSLVGVLAATALILRDLGEAEVYRTIVPFHTRTRSHWADSVGWFVGGVPIEVPVAAATDLRGALETVRAQLRTNRPLARVPIARAIALLGPDFQRASPDPCSFVSFADTRDMPLSAHWAELRAYGLVRVSYGSQVCVWVSRLHEGLRFASRFPDTDVAHKNLRRYAEALRELIASVAGRET
ncbi:condensation domain-containing protein [Streptomyces profundus]|uniref:condensation domain-containing protein n=1 Tax=Streptomyces profundus TaxID=2867410 RepID=UPI001D165944|nr:condensation domain-containing protein [Streptomyces sp. MA3_2.13]UED86655.1 acyltransferase papA2 [Streptomyces sp. MA3_2.13]